MPCLEIRGGRVVLDGPSGPTPARDAQGRLFDILDVSDQLTERYGRLYLVDRDGLEQDQPQLDYIQEIARNSEVWVDAGVRTSEAAIDVVVAGAYRTVLSTSRLRGEEELAQAWKLSTEFAFEIETRGGLVEADASDFAHRPPLALAATVRELGFVDVIYSPRAGGVEWNLARELARDGRLWVGGTFDRDDLTRLQESGATGGIFTIGEELGGAAPEEEPLS